MGKYVLKYAEMAYYLYYPVTIIILLMAMVVPALAEFKLIINALMVLKLRQVIAFMMALFR